MKQRSWIQWLNSSSGKRKSKIENLKWAGLSIIAFVLLLAGAGAQAQQPTKVPRIGYISGTGDASNPGPYVGALRQGLGDLGYVDGKNIVIEYRGAGGAEGKADPIPSLVNELVQLKVDVLIVPTNSAIRAAKQATKTIPIVMVTQEDPVASGLVDSLARPGGNITGIATLQRDLSGKRLELLTEVIPRISRVGVLWDPNLPSMIIGFKQYEAAARAKDTASIPRCTRLEPGRGGRVPSCGKGACERGHHNYQ